MAGPQRKKDPMRLRTSWDDVLEAIFLTPLPASLRFFFILLLVLLSFGVGLLWNYSIEAQLDVARLEQRQEYIELRRQVEHLWGAFEYVKTGLDRMQVDGHPRPRRAREDTPRRAGPGAARRGGD